MKLQCVLLSAFALDAATALRVTPGPSVRTPASYAKQSPVPSFDPMGLNSHATHGEDHQHGMKGASAALGMALIAASQPDAAFAKGGEYGIWEGRIVSLAHPVVMGTMYAASVFAAFTGFQWRRLREIGTEISDLKQQQTAVSKKLDGLTSSLEEDAPKPAGAAPLEAEVKSFQEQIDSLSATRKELAAGNLRDKHYQVGSVILGLGTAFAIEGPVNTFLRAQKLFPGPHLYAGAGVVVAWAMAASLVPLMSKGKESARSAHIAFNVLALGLFTWQIPTGWQITQKVLEFTKFP